MEGAVGRISLGKTMLVAAICYAIPLLVNVVVAFVTDWTGIASWLAVPVLGTVGAMLAAGVEYSASNHQAHSGAPPARNQKGNNQLYQPSFTQPRKSRAKPVAAIALVAVLVFAVGSAATFGVHYAVGYFTGNESGDQILAEPATESQEGLTGTVESIVVTDHFTRVQVTMTNNTGGTITLPLYGNTLLSGIDGTSLEADAFRSDWSNSIPADGVPHRGTIVFPGHLATGTTAALLSFVTVFGTFGFSAGFIISGIQLVG